MSDITLHAAPCQKEFYEEIIDARSSNDLYGRIRQEFNLDIVSSKQVVDGFPDSFSVNRMRTRPIVPSHPQDSRRPFFMDPSILEQIDRLFEQRLDGDPYRKMHETDQDMSESVREQIKEERDDRYDEFWDQMPWSQYPMGFYPIQSDHLDDPESVHEHLEESDSLEDDLNSLLKIARHSSRYQQASIYMGVARSLYGRANEIIEHIDRSSSE